jgi:hypothetical protein
VRAQSATRIIHTQDVYAFLAFRVDDGTGNLVDVTPGVLAQAASSLGPPIASLHGGFTLRESFGLTGRALDQNGTPYSSIAVNFAVVTADDGSAPDQLLAVTSADLALQYVT